jgi:hypothetical protein
VDKPVDYYMSLPYTVELTPDGQGYRASVEELPGCYATVDASEDVGELWKRLEKAQRERIEQLLGLGEEVPEPAGASADPFWEDFPGGLDEQDVVSGILKDPERLRLGLDHMIEQERRGTSLAGDPAAETERLLAEISKAARKRARYQEMAAEGLIDFEELRTQLAALEDVRNAAEQELRALRRRTEHLAQLERDRDSLLEGYADQLPEAIDALSPEKRRGVYKMIGLEARLAPDGSLEVSGDVVRFSNLEISSA